MSITQELALNRPNLAASSLKTYSSVLRNLQKDLKGDDIDWFSDNDEKILNHLKDKPDQTKKTTLSALFVLTKK